jgi:hypothetical protein
VDHVIQVVLPPTARGGGGASTSVYKEQGGFSVHISAWLALLQAASAACAGFLLVGTVGWRVGGPVGAC